jgi:hypothetical protein
MFLIILYLLQNFLEDFFIPLRRIILFVEKIGKLVGEFAF